MSTRTGHSPLQPLQARQRSSASFTASERQPAGWRSDAVKDALDLCLACKGCKGECPVRVDMATYKAEFLSHFYEGKLRPRHAYAFGLIYWWSRLASPVAPLVNLVSASPLGAAGKRAVGMHPARQLPRFARQTFVDWFRARPARNVGRETVLLWPG